MMGSSKYEFNPEQFEKDAENKIQVSMQFKKDLKQVIYSKYKYHDNMPMSNKAKREILIEVYKEFLENI